ncbi:MAG: methyltransferase domain-containing protein [Planctomycetia bacterium]|nr:methyltransferase domain-containing protein [Planctomycetia bacterium]
MKVNVGCGMTPYSDYVNLDNSFSLRLSKISLLPEIFFRLKLITELQMKSINFYRACKINIRLSDCTKDLLLPNNCADVVYSSHMLEHLGREEVKPFLKEAQRVLKVGGIMRIAIPDLEKKIARYNTNKDADEFIDSLYMIVPNQRSFPQRLRTAFFGSRYHQWMYDGGSIKKLLENNGFVNVTILLPGETTIPDPGSLDLCEREEESLYVEGIKR